MVDGMTSVTFAAQAPDVTGWIGRIRQLAEHFGHSP
jgi:hypothetical protein